MDSTFFAAIHAAGTAFDAKIEELIRTLVDDKATKAELQAASKALLAEIGDATRPLATKKALADAVALLATKTALGEAVAPLATKKALADGLAVRPTSEEIEARYATKEGLTVRLNNYVRVADLGPLATDAELTAAVRELVTRAELPALATDNEVREAISGLPTRAELAAVRDEIAALRRSVDGLDFPTRNDLNAALDALRRELTEPSSEPEA